MVFEHIEKLKREFTDKYVVVDENRAELRRFQGMTGTVRTVNMNGQALVEFDAHENISWYDIDIDFLKVVDQPLPKADGAKPKQPAAKPVAKKPAKAPSELEKARSAKPTAGGAGMSAADVLAAARAEKGGGTASGAKKPAPAKADPKSMSVAEMLAAARAEKGGGAGAAATATPVESTDASATRKTDVQQQLEAARQKNSNESAAATATTVADPKKMSVAQMLAYARAEKSGGAAAPPAPATDDQPSEPPPVAAEPQAAAEPVNDGEVASKSAEITEVADILAYCRKVDSN